MEIRINHPNKKENYYITNLLIEAFEDDYDDNLEIIIPTYNRTNLLEEALNSAINQKNKQKIRISVVDNSELNWKKNYDLIKEKFSNRVFYYRNSENYGLFGNWNISLGLSKARYFALLHDDDLINSAFVDKIIYIINKFKPALITNTPEIVNKHLITGKINIKLFSRLKNYFKKRIEIKLNEKIYFFRVKDFNFVNPASACAMVINRNKAFNNGGWFEDKGYSEDYFFNHRMSKNDSVIIYFSNISKYRYINNLSLDDSVKLDFIINNYNYWIQEFEEYKGLKKYIYKKISLLYFKFNTLKMNANSSINIKNYIFIYFFSIFHYFRRIKLFLCYVLSSKKLN